MRLLSGEYQYLLVKIEMPFYNHDHDRCDGFCCHNALGHARTVYPRAISGQWVFHSDEWIIVQVIRIVSCILLITTLQQNHNNSDDPTFQQKTPMEVPHYQPLYVQFTYQYKESPGACPTKYRIDKFDRIQNLLKILVPLISIILGLS